MVNEPYNLLLWHTAKVIHACSSEVSEAGSNLLSKLSPILGEYPYLLVAPPNSYNFTLQNLLTEEFIQINYDFGQAVNSKQILNASNPVIHSIREVTRIIDSELNSIISSIEDTELDLAKFEIMDPDPDLSLFQLNIFDENGLVKINQLNWLKSKVRLIANPQKPNSISSGINTTEFLAKIDNIVNSGQTILVNAVIYHLLAQRKKS